MKVSTQVEVSDTKLLEAIAKEFLVEIGLVHEIHSNGYYSRYEIGKETKFLVRDLIKAFLKENKEEIINKVVENISSKFDHATNKKMIIEKLLKEMNISE